MGADFWKPAEGGGERRWPRWAAAAFGIAWFLALGGLPTLWPTHFHWLMREDWFAHVSGWWFFRNAPWQLPLGSAPGLMYPYGTSVAFTDANPWVAVVAKLFSPVLPADFQYIGLWLGSVFVLMGYFGARLTGVFTKSPVRQALGGALCTLAPAIPARFGHPTLCAQWLLVAALWLNFRSYSGWKQMRWGLGGMLLLLALGAGFHPYWVAMVGPLAIALWVRLVLVERRFPWRDSAVALALMGLAPWAIFHLFGYLGGQAPTVAAWGFDYYSADLTSLFNPAGISRLFPALPVRPAQQGEGFGYVGLGMIVLAAFAAASLVLRRPRREQLVRILPAALAALALGAYALSSGWTFLGQQVLDLHGLYAHLGFLTAAFRVPGRFIWPLGYLFIALALSSQRLWDHRGWLAGAVLVAAIALQLSDVDAARSSLRRPPPPFQPLEAGIWDQLTPDYAHLAIYPVEAQWTCGYNEPLVTHLAYLAYRHHLTINSGYVSRTPDEIHDRCALRMPEGGLDPSTVYFPQGDAIRDFLTAGADCAMVQGLVVCVSAAKDTAFRRGLHARG